MTDNKESLFNQQFSALVAELSDPAQADTQTMVAVAALARRMMDDAKVKSWADFKRSQTRELYDTTLRTFQKHGNELVKQKKLRTAYAVQVLAMSLIARTQTHPDVQADDHKLDRIIDFLVSQTDAQTPAN